MKKIRMIYFAFLLLFLGCDNENDPFNTISSKVKDPIIFQIAKQYSKYMEEDLLDTYIL